jgi:SAM-dependent methyltransferase
MTPDFNGPIRHDENCRICGSKNIVTVFELNPTPPEDRFIPKEQLNIIQEKYPLVLALCQNCGYLHLPYILNPAISYSDYLYETKVTVGLPRHYQEYADEILSLVRPLEGSLVVDLGSNDGTMLEGFKRHGMEVLGVEPSQKLADVARSRGIPTIADFFTDAVRKEIIDRHGHPQIITANYMYANIDDILGFTQNVASLLSHEGVFAVQTGYHPEQMKINMFDYVYHEHFSYFSLKVLRYVFEKCGLDLIDAQKKPAKGGAIRAVAQLKGGKRPVSPRIAEIIREEESRGIDKPETYIRFAEKINGLKVDLNLLLGQIKKEGIRIAGYGASHSTTTLTYHFELAPFLDYLVDDNPIKKGMYSPGWHLPVYPSSRLMEDKPNYTVILAWQYQTEILRKNQAYLNQGGKFIIPLPELRVIE